VVAWHPLVDHCADVAACCEALLRRTVIGARLAVLGGCAGLSEVQIERLVVLAALHDVGKFNIGFQNKALANPKFRSGHLSEVVRLLWAPDGLASQRLLAALAIEEMRSWTSEEALLALWIATLSHHGRPVSGEQQVNLAGWKAARGLDPFAGISELVGRTRAWFPAAWRAAGDPLPEAPAFQHAWCGVVTLADWIGSDAERFFPFSDDPGADRMPLARRRAAEAVEELGLVAGPPRRSLGKAPPSFDRIAPGKSPHAAQAALLELLPGSTGGSVALLESETGSGKTEAALAYFARLFHAGRVEGMYFALPTRTAATQIYRRVHTAVDHAFPEPASRPSVVLAVPGYLEVDGVGGRRLGPFRVLWNDDPAERLRYRGWAAEHPKRYLVGAVVVGTIDQVLLSSLMVSHAHMRAAALLRHLLIVDEVHASDAYMTRILEDVLARHVAAGGHALLMSATLGAAARERLLAPAGRRGSLQIPDLSSAAATPYPLVSFRQGAERRPGIPVASDLARQKRVAVELAAELEEPAGIARRALAAARGGARVLVVRNTVAGCRATQAAVEEVAVGQGEETLLFRCREIAAPHHARYAKQDRELLDDAIEGAFGQGRPAGGRVAVATQTVQQSLDLDADFLLTDLCPMDVLLQRIGRLHRHRRDRPAGYELARVVVLVPAAPLAERIGRNGEPTGSHGLGTVYDDLSALEATRRALVQAPEISIPRDNRPLVEAATHPEALAALAAELGEPWPAHRRCIQGRWLGNRRFGKFNLVQREVSFAAEPPATVAFPTGDAARNIPTRLGEQDRLVRFRSPVASPFDASVAISEMSLRAEDVAPGTPFDADSAEEVEPVEGGLRFRFGGRIYRYDRFGLRPEDPADAGKPLQKPLQNRPETDHPRNAGKQLRLPGARPTGSKQLLEEPPDPRRPT
jgi:CRISPR-associated endonuclease/helicase Cas3